MGKQEVFDRLLEYMVRFANIRSVVALKDGFILTLPLTMRGSLSSLVSSFPLAGWRELMTIGFG